MTRSAWVAGGVVAVLAGAWFFHSQREAARLAEADRTRAEEIRAESRAYREGDSEERTAQLNARVDTAVAQLESGSPTIRCDAALQLGRIGHLDDCIAYGPGILELAHQPDEYVAIEDLVASAKVMALATLRLLGVPPA